MERHALRDDRKHPLRAAELGFHGSGARCVDGVFSAIDVALCAMASLLF
jgi:hypothetical protein